MVGIIDVHDSDVLSQNENRCLSPVLAGWIGDIEQGECLVQNNKVSKLNDVLLLPNDASLQLFWTVEDSGRSSIWSKFLRI